MLPISPGFMARPARLLGLSPVKAATLVSSLNPYLVIIVCRYVNLHEGSLEALVRPHLSCMYSDTSATTVLLYTGLPSLDASSGPTASSRPWTNQSSVLRPHGVAILQSEASTGVT